MRDETIGSMVDGLGVTVQLGAAQRLSSVLVIGKLVDMDSGEMSLVVLANQGMDWVDQSGLLAAGKLVHEEEMRRKLESVEYEDEEDEG